MNTASNVTLNFSDIDLADSVKLHNCFTKKDVGQFLESYQLTLPIHGTKIFVAEAQTRLERVRYEAETGYSKAYSEITGNVCQYSEASFCSGGYKAGWLGGSNTNNYLEWRNVYSQEGGDYQLTIGYISGESRNMTVSVNGKKVKTFSGCNSGGFDKVGKKTLDITLEPGNNVIRLSNTSGWMPDMDYIDVVSKNMTAVNAVTLPHPTTDDTYDLTGHKVQNGRGIVINNGKKYIKH